MSDPSRPALSILTVCSHNRTRSVMMAALLESLLSDRLGDRRLTVRSSGFGPLGLPAISDAVAAMKRRGLDVSQHRSSAITAELVDSADVIITAEVDHVVKIAALAPSVFPRAVTLPELLARAANPPLVTQGAGVRSWVESLTADRTAAAYLRGAVPEVPDPTGSTPRAFEAAVRRIEHQCDEASALLELADR